MIESKNIIIDFLHRFKAEPMKFIGEPSFVKARHFIDGYLVFVYDSGVYPGYIRHDIQENIDRIFLCLKPDERYFRHWTETVRLFSDSDTDAIDKMVGFYLDAYNADEPEACDKKEIDIEYFLQKIKSAPGVYVGEKDLVKISWFIKGYFHGVYGDAYTNELFAGFQDKVMEHYFNAGCPKCTRDWQDVILFFTTCKEQAFDDFFMLFESYIREIL